METDKKKQTIKLCIAISTIIIIFIVVGAIMIKYEVEGDKNMPFNLSKIMVISTAEGIEAEGEKKWNFDVFQNNDLYIYIDKNEKYNGKSKIIESIKLENIQITETPQVGKINAYMPNSVEGRIFSYSDEYIINDNLEYRGASKSNPQTLEIGNQGGSVLIRFSNSKIGNYSSDEDTEIIHDGTLLKKLELSEEQMKFKVSFDLVIKLQNYSYRANVVLDLPNEGITENGTTSFEKTDMSDIIFKRENK